MMIQERKAHSHIDCNWRVGYSMPNVRWMMPRNRIEFRCSLLVDFHFSKHCKPVYDNAGNIMGMDCYCEYYTGGQPPNRRGVFPTVISPLCRVFNGFVRVDGYSYHHDFCYMLKMMYSTNRKKKKHGFLHISKKHWKRLVVNQEGFVNNQHVVADLWHRSFAFQTFSPQGWKHYDNVNWCWCGHHQSIRPRSMIITSGAIHYYTHRGMDVSLNIWQHE